jgi:DNA-binding XRE family transcriptional regulator
MNNYRFGNYLCDLREKKNLSQKQLGLQLGISNKAISKWENGGGYPSGPAPGYGIAGGRTWQRVLQG